jgi:hypothetical protein
MFLMDINFGIHTFYDYLPTVENRENYKGQETNVIPFEKAILCKLVSNNRPFAKHTNQKKLKTCRIARVLAYWVSTRLLNILIRCQQAS